MSNIGERAGSEIVQVYVRDDKSRLPRPEKELVAFEKVYLEAGETRHIHIVLDKFAVGYYDEAIPGWIAEEGSFKVLIGASSADIRYVGCGTRLTDPVDCMTNCVYRHSVAFSVNESFTWLF